MIPANVAALGLFDVLVDRDSIQIHVSVNVQNLHLHALMIRNSMMWHANVSVRTDPNTALTHRYLTMTNADVDAPIYSDALEDKDSIQILVSVNVQNLHLRALTIRNLMMWHASAFAQIDQSAARILRYLTMTNADVDAPMYSDALEDRDSIQIHVNVNVQNLHLRVLMIRNSMMWHANVFAPIDQSAVLILRYLTMTNADVDAPMYSDALEDRDSIQIHVSVNVQNLHLRVLMIRNSTMWHANVSALIDQIAAHTHKFLTMIPVNVAALGLFNVLVDRDSIQIHVSVNAQSQDLHALMIRNLMMWHANVSVRIDQSAAHTLRYLTMINAGVSAPIYSDAQVDRDSIQIHVSAVAPRYTDALVDNGLIHIHVNVSVLNQELSVPMIKTLTT